MQKPEFEFHDSVIVRSPLYPYNEIGKDFYEVLNKPEFQEAIFLSSPGLWKAIFQDKNGLNSINKRQLETLYKYHARSTYKCTPFGMFAGIFMAKWDDETNIKIQRPEDSSLYANLDLEFLNAFYARLEEFPEVQEHLRYYPNSSIFSQSDEIRYVELVRVTNTHVSASVDNNEVISAILDKTESGMSKKEIVDWMVEMECDREEAEAFVSELISSSLLVSQFEISTTEADPIGNMKEVLNKVSGLEEVKQLVDQFEQFMTRIQKDRSLYPDAFLTIRKQCEAIGVKFNKDIFLQIDSQKTVLESPTIKSSHKKNILEALAFMRRFFYTVESDMDLFVKKFLEAYDTREMPLLQVLDPDLGIGYPVNKEPHGITPLVEGLHPESGGQSDLRFSPMSQKFIKLLMSAAQRGEKVIDFNKHIQEFEQPEYADRANPGPSIYCLIKMLANDEVELLTTAGVSATPLAGRFAGNNEELQTVLEEIAEHDKSCLPAFEFAEVLHSPDNDAINVLRRSNVWGKDIPYLDRSTLPKEDQISLNDLVISVNESARKIFIKSKKTGKLIMPRLTSAHNYRKSNQPVYRFLCEYQFHLFDGYMNLNLEGYHAILSYIPKLVYKNVVISQETWILQGEDKKKYTNKIKDGNSDTVFGQLRNDLELGRYFLIGDGMNQLLIDSESPEGRNVCIVELKRQPVIVIKRHEMENEFAVQDSNGGVYNHEILTFIKNNNCRNYDVGPDATDSSTPNQCLLGDWGDLGDDSLGNDFQLNSSENLNKNGVRYPGWNYFKIYGGNKFVDQLLVEQLAPMLNELQSDGRIEKWFFIRYSDPDWHLRLRVNTRRPEQFVTLIHWLNKIVGPLVQKGVIPKFQTDIYKRELARYGGQKNIDTSERIFCIDSVFTSKLLAYVHALGEENLRWQIGLWSVSQYLEVFNVSLVDRKLLFDDLKESFAQEFNVTFVEKKEIEQRYRKFENIIEAIVQNSASELEGIYPQLNELFDARMAALEKPAKEFCTNNPPEVTHSVLVSFLHMTLNRIFIANPRFQEYVVYAFLSRIFNKLYHKQKKLVHA